MDWSLLSREVEKLRFLRADRYVVQLLEVGWNAQPPFYVMEYMERGALEDQIEQRPPTVPEAVAMIREVAVGLVHAHARGILHCDLKPANILLDQDGKPRLADFGQARLTHDQNPALGTLFYMAPEQADLKAAPDARWDVYALGAILYRMLTGELPYRTPEAVADIQETARLEDRLRRYRHFIQRAPRPTAHRKVPGVDARLAEVVDRCLAVKPEKRFANPQAVLHALDSRALQRARRPLLVLGAVGPALLVLVVALFAWRGLDTAVTESDQALVRKSLLSDRFAARFVAASVARKMMQRWNILSEEAQKPAFQKLVQEAAGKDRDSPQRRALQEWLDERRQEYLQTSAARAWFLLDSKGHLLAVSPLTDRSRQSLGKDLSYRSYFHGGDRDYTPEEAKNLDLKPITRPTQSSVFESKTEDQPLMVVFSVPVVAPDSSSGGTLGVLAMGVRLGSFKELHPGESEGATDEPASGRTAVLISTKKDWEGRLGLILQHPWLERLSREQKQAPKVHVPADVVERLVRLRRLTLRREEARGGHGAQHLVGDEEAARKDALMDDYVDPVCALSRDSGNPWNADYTGTWLAAAEPVLIPPTRDGSNFLDTGWVVLVEERTQDALGPVRKLRGELIVQDVETLLMLLAILAGLWAFVLVVLNDSSRSRLMTFLRRRAGLSSVGGGGTATSGVSSLPRPEVSGTGPDRETAPTVPFSPSEPR
jgi:serine/threonine protein kinase